MAADEVWKGIGLEGAVNALAYREAAQAGLKGQARAARIAELLSTPATRDRLAAKARPEMLERVFQQEAGPITEWVSKGRQQVPGFRYIVPFVRIGANIGRATVARTPLGVISMANQARLGKLGTGEAVDATAKMLLGTAVGAWAMSLRAQGRLTGSGPGAREPGKRATQATVGPPPNSLRIGDTWLDFSRLGPLGMQLSMAANAADAIHDPLVSPEDVAVRVTFGFARQMSDQSFMTGLRNAIDATEDERKAAGFLKRFAASWVPSVVKQLTRAVDPEAKRVAGLGSRLRATLPGRAPLPVVGGALPLRNLWGEPIQSGPGGMLSLLSPMRMEPARLDPVNRELARLVQGVGLSIGAPQASRTAKGVTTALAPEDYDQLTVRAGTLAKGLVTDLIRQPWYQRQQDDEARATLVRKKFEQARSQARKELNRMLELRDGQREVADPMPPLGAEP